MADCRAAVITAHRRPLEIQRVTIPKLDAGSMLVRIEASTLCGTDVHRWHGPLQGEDSLPVIVGHEPCGVIEEIAGTKADILGQPLRPGDRVVWSYVACGNCYWCTAARQPSVCATRVSWGHNRCDRPPYLLGSVAEYMYVPNGSHVVRVPEGVSSASAAASACAYRTVMHGFDNLGAIKSHETVVIQGCGPLGSFAAAVARDHGAKQVLVIGAPEARLKVSRQMGADATLDIDVVTDAAKRREWVNEHTQGRGADVVLQMANLAAIPEGLSMLRRGGRYVIIGAGGKASIDAGSLPFEMVLHTIVSGEPRHWLQAMDFLETRASRYPFEDMITTSFKLEEINEAMQAMASFQVVKAVIHPHLG